MHFEAGHAGDDDGGGDEDEDADADDDDDCYLQKLTEYVHIGYAVLYTATTVQYTTGRVFVLDQSKYRQVSDRHITVRDLDSNTSQSWSKTYFGEETPRGRLQVG